MGTPAAFYNNAVDLNVFKQGRAAIIRPITT